MSSFLGKLAGVCVCIKKVVKSVFPRMRHIRFKHTVLSPRFWVSPRFKVCHLMTSTDFGEKNITVSTHRKTRTLRSSVSGESAVSGVSRDKVL